MVSGPSPAIPAARHGACELRLGAGRSRGNPRPGAYTCEGRLMPIAAVVEWDELLSGPADAACPPLTDGPDDSGTHDLADLWRDLGGGD